MDVKLEIDLRSRLDEPAGSVREHIALLADGVFVEKHALLSHLERPIGAIELTAAAIRIGGFDDRGPDMVDDREAFCRNDLNTLDVPILLQAGIDQNVRPL